MKLGRKVEEIGGILGDEYLARNTGKIIGEIVSSIYQSPSP